MTSGGNDEQVGKAKKILYTSIIGLIIILSAYSISNFVLKIYILLVQMKLMVMF